MKIFMINSVCGIRSTGRICTDLAEVLHENGHECRIAYGREDVPDKYKIIAYRIGNNNGVRSHALGSRLFDRTGFYSKKQTEKLVDEIERYCPDVIHLHNLHGYYLNIEVLFEYLAEANIPIVWTLHDCWAFTGHCAHFSLAGCDRWKTGCFDCPQKRSYPSALLFDRSKDNWKRKKELFTSVKNMTVVTPSQWMAGLVKESFLQKYSITVIPNGIDLSVFKPTPGDFRKKYSLQGKRIILGVASLWDDRKGLNDFIKLADLIDDNTRIVLVGLNKKQIRSLPSNIIGIERTNDIKELAEIYTAADVFFNPSKEETMGLTTVEAMACGTPVVVSDRTAVPEVVTEYGGVVAEEMSAERAKTAINEIFQMTFRPLDNAERYEKNTMFFRYLDLYAKVFN